MASDALSFGPQATLPLTSSLLFDRPYLNIRSRHSKRQKPNFSKLSILTKSSICSTKHHTKENYRPSAATSKAASRKNHTKNPTKSRTKRRDESLQHKSIMTKTTKIDALALSQQQYGLQILRKPSPYKKHSPLSRTGKKPKDIQAISPLYSSAIFNQKSCEKSEAREGLSSVLERTGVVLKGYQEQCKMLRQQRDFFKKKYERTLSRLKKVSEPKRALRY